MGYAILFCYIITLLAATVIATIENKNKAKVSALEGKAYAISIIGCLITSIILAIWLNTLGDSDAAVGAYTYYVNGVRVGSGAMFVTQSIFIAFIGASIGSMLTSFLAHIPAFMRAGKLKSKSNIMFERKKFIAVLLWLCLCQVNIHLLYLGLWGLFLIRLAIIAAAIIFSGLKMMYIGSPLLIISVLWWLFDIVYILKSKQKFYTADTRWIKQ